MRTLIAAPALAFLAACTTFPPSELETPPLVFKHQPTTLVGIKKYQVQDTLKNSYRSGSLPTRSVMIASFRRQDGSIEKVDCTQLAGKWGIAIVNLTQDGISKREQRELDTQIAQYKEADTLLGCPRIEA